MPASPTSAWNSVTECLPIYSGGLGVLAEITSNRRVIWSSPLVGVGLLHQQGYFTQRLNADGWHRSLQLPGFRTLPVLPQWGRMASR